MIGTKSLQDDTGSGSSGRAERVINDQFPKTASETVLIQARDGTTKAADPAFQAPPSATSNGGCGSSRRSSQVHSPLSAEHASQISKDGRSALMELDIAGDDDQAEAKVDAILASVAAAQKAHPDLRIEEFGDASADKALSDRLDKDFRQAEFLSLPITLVILIVTFGALVAAGLPVLLALTSVAAALGLVAIPSQIWPVDDAVCSVILLIGMAVGVDYSLFYMRREREERERGADEKTALQIAAATSGRAVLISGLTVMIAMAGMYLTGDSTFTGMATGTLIVVGVAMIGSVTVLPALLAVLGDKVNKARVPFLHRLRRPGQTPRAWSWVLDRVLRHPLVSTIAATAVLVALALPALNLHLVVPGTDSLPRDIPVMQTYDRIQAAFPGGPTPAQVVVQTDDVRSPQVTEAIDALRREALASKDMGGPCR